MRQVIPLPNQSVKKRIADVAQKNIALYGTTGWDKAEMLRPFTGMASRSSLHRWMDEAVARLRPGAAATKAMRDATAQMEREAAEPDRLAAKADAVLATAVLPPGPADLGGTLLSVEALMGEMQACVQNARDVAKFARTPEGAVRLSKTLLAASEHNRRCMETLLRIQEAWRTSGEIDRFMDAVVLGIRDVAKLHPEAARMMLERLRAVTGRWN
jgi:hypothetical protein